MVYTVYTMFVIRVIKSLRNYGVRAALTGGYAVSLHGAVRGTVDVDLVIPLELDQFERTAQALEAIGLVAKLPITPKELFHFRDEYIQRRNLIAWSFVNNANPIEIVDLIITHDLRNLKTKTISVVGEKIEILTIDSLIEMKTASGRKQDWADIEALQKLK